MSFEAAVHAQAIDLCKLSLDMCVRAGSGHPTTAMSLSHITTVLMFHSMRWSPDHPDYPTADRLVLSQGHGVPVVYAAYARLGGMVGKNPAERVALTVDDLATLRDVNSVLDGHPNPMEGFPFFDVATGSLGQGLSASAGLAEAARLDGIDRRIYCIIGDGESREGQIGEALDYIVDNKLTSVLPIFNCNGWGQASKVSPQQSPAVLSEKLKAFGFDVIDIDGHAPVAIRDAFAAFTDRQSLEDAAPIALIARTVKGWGAPSLQMGNWHGKAPSGDALDKALAEIDQAQVELTSALVQSDQFVIQPPATAPEREPSAGEIPSLSDTMQRADMAMTLQAGQLATRKAYGLALRALGSVNDQVVVLDADVSNSTFAETFAREPALADRFFECKIAEQNMVSAAAGLAAAGKIPFVSSFAKFLTRAYDQVEMAIYSGANVKLVGSHSGVTLAADGPSQMGLVDVPYFRSWTRVRNHNGDPACYLLQPADAFAAYALTAAMAEYDGFCYMRTLRSDTELLYSDQQVFNLGGFEVLSEGRDIVLVAAGYMVHEANKALDLLDRQGVDASLIDMYSLPFDGDALLDVAQANNAYVLTIEDNFGGGIGSAVADVMTASGDSFTLDQMCVQRPPKSARTPSDELRYVGLSANDIAKRALAMLEVGVA